MSSQPWNLYRKLPISPTPHCSRLPGPPPPPSAPWLSEPPSVFLLGHCTPSRIETAASCDRGSFFLPPAWWSAGHTHPHSAAPPGDGGEKVRESWPNERKRKSQINECLHSDCSLLKKVGHRRVHTFWIRHLISITCSIDNGRRLHTCKVGV